MNIQLWAQERRQKLLIGGPLALLLVIALLYIFGGRYISTDDAYVKAGNVSVSSNVPGRVVAIYVHDNERVKKGTLLFRLDDRPYKIAVENAQAELMIARLQIEALKATYQKATADVKAAQDTLTYQQKEFKRQQRLAVEGISSQRLLNKVQNAFDLAQQELAALVQQQSSIYAELGANLTQSIEQYPIVQKAQAALNQAKLNLLYTKITASIDGIVTKVEQLQVGDYAEVGAPLFALISNQDIWVEANFKETQITHMHPGQKVSILIDTYPGKTFYGQVLSLSPGTGSTFSLLPPENATGNWVKIVQRLPVRISIDNPGNPGTALFLQSGLSATVTVDTKKYHRFFSSDSHYSPPLKKGADELRESGDFTGDGHQKIPLNPSLSKGEKMVTLDKH